MREIAVHVLIVGGGGRCGLTAPACLSELPGDPARALRDALSNALAQRTPAAM